MSTSPHLAELLVLFFAVFAVLHVAEVVLEYVRGENLALFRRLNSVSHLALHFILVDVGEVVLRKLERKSKEGVQRIQHFAVQALHPRNNVFSKPFLLEYPRRHAHPRELFYLRKVLLNPLGMVMLEITVELYKKKNTTERLVSAFHVQPPRVSETYWGCCTPPLGLASPPRDSD